jgi:uroporphyrinogen decarboxylase
MMTGKERVYKTIRFEDPDRLPVDIWVLQAAYEKHGPALENLIEEADIDFSRVPFNDPTYDPLAFDVGVHTDIWGCEWHNHQRGILGEVKGWPLADDDKVPGYKTPVGLLRGAKPADLYRGTAEYLEQHPDKFALCGWMSLFERMQFLRGTENLYCDIALETDEFFAIRDMVLEFWLEYANLVSSIEGVDACIIGDDWGSQRALLIAPEVWRRLFKPAYQQISDVVRGNGKQLFFHSDGYILDLYDDMVDLGVTAINSQVWCMGLDTVAQKTRGRLACWGELNRQETLPFGTPADITACIGQMKETFWQHGGLIGQFEAGRDAPLENVRAALFGWNGES